MQINYPISRNPWEVIFPAPVLLLQLLSWITLFCCGNKSQGISPTPSPDSRGGPLQPQSEAGLPFNPDSQPPSYEEIILKPSSPPGPREVVVRISLDHAAEAGGGQVPAESRGRFR